MRADRLLSLLMLLQHRGLLSAAQIAEELEVSERTVLRDVEALSASGVPVYAERGRRGGFRLLPGFRTDLTALTLEEAQAVLAGGPGQIASPAFVSAMRKVAAALPETHREAASRAATRILVRPEGFVHDEPEPDHLAALSEAVFAGRRLTIDYRPPGRAVRLRTIDPVGLVHAAGHWYLMALRDGEERCYRVSRITDLTVLDEPARRPDTVDLPALWRRQRNSFRAGFEPVTVTIAVEADDVDRWSAAAARLVGQRPRPDGRVDLDLRFGDRTQAERMLWLGHAHVVSPPELRDALRAAARAMLDD